MGGSGGNSGLRRTVEIETPIDIIVPIIRQYLNLERSEIVDGFLVARPLELVVEQTLMTLRYHITLS